MYFLILPNQLFESKYIDKKYKIILWECPHYFIYYKYNKKKLLLHRASMKYYFDYLKGKGYDVIYKSFEEKLNSNETYILYNPLNKIELLEIPNAVIYEKSTPNILLTPELITEYRNQTDKYFFNAFYMWLKRRLNILPGVKSQDRKNRKKPKENEIKNVSQPYKHIYTNSKDSEYIKEAKEYVEKHFKNNYGNTDNFIFPITHKDSKKWLEHFIENKFKLFGDYQDYIDKNDNHLYHSLLSSLINIGLINPIDVITRIETIKTKIPLNSYEGFVRQIFWREYQYYCYINIDFTIFNYFNNRKVLTKDWYNGTLNIEPVDDAIKEGFNTGYLHHIKRLMVIGNYMNLSEIDAKEGFIWFMEFSCDSYEWVMHQNVYDMVFFVTNGKTMRRPYISSSNYILKMSNYKKDKWCDIWDKKYKDFVLKNKKKLYKYRYYVRM